MPILKWFIDKVQQYVTNDMKARNWKTLELALSIPAVFPNERQIFLSSSNVIWCKPSNQQQVLNGCFISSGSSAYEMNWLISVTLLTKYWLNVDAITCSDTCSDYNY